MFTIAPLRHQLSSFVCEPPLTIKLIFRFLKTIRMLNKLDCLPNFINLIESKCESRFENNSR